jgi:predicted ATPase/DNA-binding CsgD family transcriptional regulator
MAENTVRQSAALHGTQYRPGAVLSRRPLAYFYGQMNNNCIITCYKIASGIKEADPLVIKNSLGPGDCIRAEHDITSDLKTPIQELTTSFQKTQYRQRLQTNSLLSHHGSNNTEKGSMDSFDRFYIEPLTERETAILRALIDGLSNREIADRLYLAPSTVKWYVRQLNSKLETNNRDEIIERAHQMGLLENRPSAAAPRHNLPAQTMPFVGREAELAELSSILKDPSVHLVTILAPGGMGKTSLALEVAARLLPQYADGVFLVELASLGSFDDQLLSSLRVFIEMLKSGYSLLQCFEDVAARAPEPTASVFYQVVEDVRSGVSFPEALERIRYRVRSSYFGEVIAAIAAQFEESGNLAERLDAVSQSLYAQLGEVLWSDRIDYAERLIVTAIAETVGYQFNQDRDSLKQQVVSYLADKRLLLLLDNFQHLLDGTGVVLSMLQSAPGVKILVTSQEKLNLTGETIFTLGGLNFPSGRPESAMQYDAVRLLVQAAKRIKPDFEPTHTDLKPIIRICQLTEGMPLGILLAASWLDTLTLAEIVTEIQKNVDFLETEMRDLPARQRSIRAVFESVWQRLKPAERDIFVRMAVFRGGCTREAAETVAGATLRVLHSLVNKSLLVHTHDGFFHLHELLRQYAIEQLEPEEYHAARSAHMNYYAQMAYEQSQRFLTADHPLAIRTLDADLDNIRAALRWIIRTRARHAVLQVADLLPYFEARGLWQEGLDAFTQILQAISSDDEEDIAIARAKEVISFCAFRLRLPEYEPFVQETVELIERMGERYRGYLVAFGTLALYKSSQGDFAAARAILNRRLELAQQQRNDRAVRNSLHALSMVLIAQGDFERGQEVLTESTQMAQEYGDVYTIAFNLHNLADVVFYQGDINRAEVLYEESLDLARQLTNIPLIYANLLYLANLAYGQQQFDAARRLIAEANEYEEKATALSAMQKYVLLSLIALQEGDYQTARQSTLEGLIQIHDFTELLAPNSMHLLEPAINLLVVAGRLTDAVHWLAFMAQHQMYDPLARARLQRLTEQIRTNLDEETYNAAWTHGADSAIETLSAQLIELLRTE